MRVVRLAVLFAGIATADQRPPRELLTWLQSAATQHGVPVELVYAVIEVESAWQPRAVSPKGAVGLMQLMPGTAASFGITNRFDMEQNIGGGVAYLGRLILAFGGDLRLATAAYFAGERRVARRGLRYSNAEVHGYVVRVAAAYRKYQRLKEVDRDDELEVASAAHAVAVPGRPDN